MMEKVGEEIKLAELKKGNLLKEIENIHKVSSSLFLFSLQWKDLESHFDGVKNLVEERVKEAEKSIREQSEEARKGFESREMELMRKERNLIDLRKGVFEETGNRRKELLEMEERVEELKKKVERREKVVLWKEKIVEKTRKDAELKEEKASKAMELVNKRVGELELAESRLRLLGLKMDEQLKEIKSNEERVKRFVRLSEEQCEKLEVKEAEFNVMKRSVEILLEELKLKEQCSHEILVEIDQRFTELDMKEKASNLIQAGIDKRTKELDDRENTFVSAQKEVCLRSQGLDVKQKSLESLQKDIDLRSKELDMKVKSLDSSKKEIDRHYEELKAKDMSFKLIEEKLDRRVALLERNHVTFDSIKKEIEQSNEELEVKRKYFDLVQKEVNQQSADLEAKEKTLHLTQIAIDQAIDDLEAKEKCFEEQIDQRIAELEDKQQLFEEQCHEIELKEKSHQFLKKTIEEQVQILDRLRAACGEPTSKEMQHFSVQNVIGEFLEVSIKERLKDLSIKEEQINLMQKLLEERSKELEVREKSIKSIPHAPVKVEEKQNLLRDKAKDAFCADIRFSVTMDGKNLQIFLNKQLKKNDSIRDEVPSALQMSSNPSELVLDAMQGFYPPHLRDGNLEFETSVVRESCIFLLNQLRKMSLLIKPRVRDKALELAKEWYEQIKLETCDFLQVLGFLELIATYKLMDAFDTTQLLSYTQSVSGHVQLSELRKALGFTEMVPCDAICLPDNKSMESEVCYVRQSAEVAFSDGKHMLLLLKEHSNNEEILLNRVSAALDESGNAAQLVLDALKLYYSQCSTVKDDSEFRPSFTLLLKQLMKTSPKLEPHVREDAIKLASEWKEELIDKAKDDSSLVILGFLWILAAYGLGSSFPEDVVAGLLKAIAASKEARDTCQVLGFEEKIVEYVEVLQQQKEWLEALNYVCAFGLEKRFPVVPLLENQVKLCKDDADRLREVASSPVLLGKALSKERNGLQVVMRAIIDHKLEDEYPLEHLEKRIVQLERDCIIERNKRHQQQKIEEMKNKRLKTAPFAEDAPIQTRHASGTSTAPLITYPGPDRGSIRSGINPRLALVPFAPRFMFSYPAADLTPEELRYA